MQSEEEYQDWIKSFYKGSFLVGGWDARRQELLAAVQDAGRRQEVGRLIDELGEIIAPEWAKENGVRKIDTADLIRWGGQMKAKTGSDDELIAAIGEIKAEALGRLE